MSERDWSSISPSARAILLVRSQTTLPHAHRAAELLFDEHAVEAAFAEMESSAIARAPRAHFEKRARSLDDALARIGAENILEIAAGFSFRGLAWASRHEGVFYMDTDLPDVILQKKALVGQLEHAPLVGTLELRALDAFDPASFHAAVAAIPPGPLAIVQEGLFMYLDTKEKTLLARTVHETLVARGGAWLTADVYVRTEHVARRDDELRAFVEKHDIDAKKFASFDDALDFFDGAGFRVDARIAPSGQDWQPRETWILRPAP